MEHQPTDQSILNKPVSITDRLKGLKLDLYQHIRRCWGEAGERAHIQALAESLNDIGDAVISIGDEAEEWLNNSSPGEFMPRYVLYEWMDQAKSFLILWRDVLFQTQKAWLMVSVREVNIAQFQKLREESQKSVEQAASVLLNDLDELPAHPLNNAKQLEKWGFQDTPWQIYKAQLSQLPQQGEALRQQSDTLWNSSGTFVLIGSHFLDTYDAWLQQIDQLKTGLTALLQQVDESPSVDRITVAEQLEQLNDQWLQVGSPEKFQNQLDDYLSDLPGKERVVVDVNGGSLMYKDVDLQKSTRSWLESELVSDIYDLNTIRDSVSNKISLSSVNIRNRLAVDRTDEPMSDQQSASQALQNFLSSLDRSKESILKLKESSLQQIREHFIVTRMYTDKFLPRSLQYTITQYRDAARWQELRNWVKEKGARVTQFRQDVRAEEALSVSERVVRLVKSRSPQKDNSHYTNLYLNEGWIGDSFVVGREQELNRVKALVDNWKLGFRGSVLVTGKRFSGKSLFVDLVDHRFFRSAAIRLAPNSRLVIGQHEMDTGCELKSVFQFVDQHWDKGPAMVLLDDLEHWHDDQTPLAKNVDILLEFIDHHASQLFFVVAMSNWLKAHLAQAFAVDKVFQSEINLGSMRADELRQAIYVRHSATHTELINEEKEEMNSSQLYKYINRIHQLSEGNIGEALHRWAYSVEKYTDRQIMVKNTPSYGLPSFLSSDSALLLRAIMLQKETSRYLLRKQFGPAFILNYQVVLQRLLNLGILKDQRSWIQVNPYLANDVARMLSKKLDFSYQFTNNSKERTVL